MTPSSDGPLLVGCAFLRFAACFGLAVLASQAWWRWAIAAAVAEAPSEPPTDAPSLRVFGAALAGAAGLALFGAGAWGILDLGAPGVVVESSTDLLRDGLDVARTTQLGRASVGLCLLTGLAVALARRWRHAPDSPPRDRILLGLVIASVFCLAAMGHGGADGLWSWTFAVHALHQTFAVLWLAGTLALTASAWRGVAPTPVVLRAYSRTARRLVVALLLLGWGRLGLVYLAVERFEWSYLLVVGVKLVLVVAVLVGILRLHRCRDSGLTSSSPAAAQRTRRFVVAELALLLAILAASEALSQMMFAAS